MIPTQYLVFVFVFALTVYIFRKRRPKNFPPGPMSLPFIGNLHQLGEVPYKTFMQMSKTYGNVFSIDFGSYRGIVLNDCNSIREAYSKDAFSGRPRLRPYVERSGGIPRGVLLSDGKTWVEQRRFILKTLRDFGFGKKTMEGMIQEEIKELIELFQTEVGKPIRMTNRFNAPILNSLWYILTGDKFALDDPVFKKIVYNLTEALAEGNSAGGFLFFPTLSKLFPEWLGYNKFMIVMTSAFAQIKETVKFRKETFEPGHPRDIIDTYLCEIMKTKDPQSSFHETEGELNLTIALGDLFLAGAETTSTSLSWTFFILAQKKAEQEKLYNEINKVVGLSRMPSLSDRDSMPYTEALIMEVLRFYSILPLGVFHSTTHNTNLQGYFIPKGTLVISNVYAVLRDTKTWGDPDVFRPERFLLPDGKLKRHHEAFIPFSTGKRVCLGEALARDELFLFVTSLFQKFKVLNDFSQPIPSLNECISGMTLSPKPHSLILEER